MEGNAPTELSLVKNIDIHPSEVVQPELRFSTQTLTAVYELVSKNVIAANPQINSGAYPYLLDLDQAATVLQNLDQEEQLDGEVDKQQLEAGAKKAFNQVVKAFVEQGIVPASLAVQVGKLLRPSSVEVLETDYHRFLYLQDEFPKTSEGRAALEIGVDRYRLMRVELESYLKAAKISLTEEQLQNVLLRWGVSHEYGHAVSRTLEILQIEKFIKGQPQGEYLYIAERGRNLVNGSVYSDIAADQELRDILQDEPEDGLYTRRNITSSERIAAGFEYLGLQYALEDNGLSREQGQSILQQFATSDEQQFQQCQQLVRFIRTQKIGLDILGQAMTSLSLDLKRNKMPHLSSLVPTNFGPRYFGYFKPLSGDQVREFVARLNPLPSKNV